MFLLDEDKDVIVQPPVDLPLKPKKNLLQHGAISNRLILQDINMLVEAVPFSSIGRIQPFLISITSSATLLIDFHCHLTTNEVSGYLGGTWDFNTHNLNITHAFPLLNTRFDRDRTTECEYEIQKAMIKKDIQLVGWYHSHPRFSPQPTLRDCDKQMDYQIKLRGTSDATYTPCVGFIFGSYDDENVENEGQIIPFWVQPPPENRSHELGRPMLMTYTVHQEERLNDGVKEQMIACVNYYKQFQYEMIDFAEMKLREGVMVLEKLKNSMFQRFPLEDQTTGVLWNWIRELLGLNRENPVAIPRKIIEQKKRLEIEAKEKAEAAREAAKEKLYKEQEEKKVKDEREQEATKQALNAISCLQQQLSQPSGLNMTPSPISSSILSMPPTNHKQSLSSNNTNTSSSPRDSPATIPSTATSPAKFEVPVRASPSPAKSDTSSIRARNSPAPSPAKLPERPPRNSSSISSNSSKYDLGYSSNNLSDLYAATLASFAKNLPPGLMPNDYSALLQGSKMSDFGMSALGSLQASAAALSANNNFSNQQSASSSNSGKKNQSYSSPKQSNTQSSASNNSNSWLSQIPNMKEFMNQLEKGDLSVLMQSPYNIPTCKPSNNKSSPVSSSSARTDYHHDNIREREPTNAGKRKGRPPNPSGSNFDYDGYKSEVGKIADLMKSPEYTQMLMNQANAFRGLGSEITVTRKTSAPPSTSSSNNKKASATATATSNQNYSQGSSSSRNDAKSSLLQHLPVMDLNYLAEISKQIPELNALLNSNKPEDINALLQMQMMSKNMDYATALFGGGGGVGNQGGGSAKSSSSTSSAAASAAATNKAMQDYATASSNMISQYMSGQQNLSSLFGPMYGSMSGGSLTSMEKSVPRESNSNNSRKRDNSNRNSGSSSSQSSRERQANVSVAPNAADMLNSLFSSATKGASSLSAAQASLMHSDLSAYFSSPPSAGMASSASGSKVNNSTSGGGISSAMDYSSLFSHMTPSKLQEMTSLFSQSKYPGIPDPLAKSTLAANNAYLSPSLMKLQQEALNTRLMKPPKSSSSSSSSKIETPPPLMNMSSPQSDKPTKSQVRDSSPVALPKYNFNSAADLAISSHVAPSASTTPTDFSRKSTPTPPVDLAMKDRSVPPKKRMEFSSIAELVAPSPSKRQKYDDDENEDEPAVLNLSNN